MNKLNRTRKSIVFTYRGNGQYPTAYVKTEKVKQFNNNPSRDDRTYLSTDGYSTV